MIKDWMKDKVVIITGASSGIGKALAYKLGSKRHKSNPFGA